MKKKSNIKRLLFRLLILFMSSLFLPVQQIIAQAGPDSLGREPVWQQRKFSAETLRQLQDDSALVYPVAAADTDWWTRFREWLFSKLSLLIGEASGSGVLDAVVYIFCLGAVIFIIIRLLDIDISSLARGRVRATPIGVGEGIVENIHVLDFDQEIALAVQQQDYRRAVRLLYLASLKRLSDAGVIRWEPGKTNRQYQLELKDPAFKQQFASLGYFFEYAWYGDFPVDEPLFRQVEQSYRQFSKQLEVVA